MEGDVGKEEATVRSSALPQSKVEATEGSEQRGVHSDLGVPRRLLGNGLEAGNQVEVPALIQVGNDWLCDRVRVERGMRKAWFWMGLRAGQVCRRGDSQFLACASGRMELLITMSGQTEGQSGVQT